MSHFGKRIVLAIILVQIIALPILLIASKNQQETRSNASELTTVELDTPPEIGTSETDNSESVVISSGEEVSAPANQIAVNKTTPKLKKQVYAFLWAPYVDKADSYIQYPLVTTLAYAGVTFNKNGSVNQTTSVYKLWKSKKLNTILTKAHNKGAKIHLRFALFNTNGKNPVGEMLSSKANRDNAVKSIVSEVKNSPNPIDGVNIDFESVPTANRDQFTLFIKDLRTELNKVNPKLEIVIDVFASTGKSEGGFDLKKLSPNVNGFFVMSFTLVDYRNSKQAGSPDSYQAMSKVADTFLAKVPGNKVILGFPLYTGIWTTKDGSYRSEKITGTGGKTILYDDARAQAAFYGKKYDDKQKSAWYTYQTCSAKPEWKQVYFDDARAQTEKFAIASTKNLQGVGFWTLNEDQGSLDTWQALYNAFTPGTGISAPIKQAGFVTASFNSKCKAPVVTTTITPSRTPLSIDINKDGNVDLLDWNLVNACSVFTKIRNEQVCPTNSANQKAADLDSSGTVNEDDITYWLQTFRDIK